MGRVPLVVGVSVLPFKLVSNHLERGGKNTEKRWRWRTVRGGGGVDGGSLLSFKQKDWFELSNS